MELALVSLANKRRHTVIVVGTGLAGEANALPIAKEAAHLAMDAAECIGSGACVAASPNSAAMLFVAAKVSHLGLLPQWYPPAHGIRSCASAGGCTGVR